MRKKGPLILKFIFTDGMQMDIKQAYEHDLWMLFFLLRKHSFSILYWAYSYLWFQTSINFYLIQEDSFLQEAFFFLCRVKKRRQEYTKELYKKDLINSCLTLKSYVLLTYINNYHTSRLNKIKSRPDLINRPDQFSIPHLNLNIEQLR